MMRPIDTGRTIDLREGTAAGSTIPPSRPGAELVPGGISPPETIPTEALQHTIEVFQEGQRLDMGALAQRIGWSRATLYRKVPPREVLLGEVVWYLARLTLVAAIDATASLTGPERVAGAAGRFMLSVSQQPGFRRLLEQEPEVALRILTSKHGPVQAGMTVATEALMTEEMRRGSLSAIEDPQGLAYAIVRIGEGFLYADLIAGESMEIDRARRVISLLLQPLGARDNSVTDPVTPSP